MPLHRLWWCRWGSIFVGCCSYFNLTGLINIIISPVAVNEEIPQHYDPNGYGVEFVYDLPKEIWKDDINGALNYVKVLPTEGAEALEDRTQGVPTFGKDKVPAE